MALPWVRLDIRIPMSPEIGYVRGEPGGDKAAFIFLACLMWTKQYEQDGHIPTTLLRMYGGTLRHARLLEQYGLWIPTAGGWITLWDEDPRPPTRKHIPNQVRRAVHERDEHACIICGSTDRLTLDHIVHWSLGGPDTVDNLRTLCHSCNSSRGAKTDEEWLGVGTDGA